MSWSSSGSSTPRRIFDYVDNLAFSDHAVEKGIAALRAGCDIVTDTQMAKAGINKTILASLGGSTLLQRRTQTWRRRPRSGA